MFSKIAKWLFSATPKLATVENKTISVMTVQVNKIKNLLKHEDLNKELSKADSVLFKISVHTKSIHKLIEISKAIHYKVIDSESYRDIGQNLIVMDLGYYLSSKTTKVDIKDMLENLIVVLKYYDSKVSLTYKEKSVLDDIITLVESIDFLINFGKGRDNGTNF